MNNGSFLFVHERLPALLLQVLDLFIFIKFSLVSAIIYYEEIECKIVVRLRVSGAFIGPRIHEQNQSLQNIGWISLPTERTIPGNFFEGSLVEFPFPTDFLVRDFSLKEVSVERFPSQSFFWHCSPQLGDGCSQGTLWPFDEALILPAGTLAGPLVSFCSSTV